MNWWAKRSGPDRPWMRMGVSLFLFADELAERFGPVEGVLSASDLKMSSRANIWDDAYAAGLNDMYAGVWRVEDDEFVLRPGSVSTPNPHR